jgi:hypothetical protein
MAVSVRNNVGKRARPAYLAIVARSSANASRLPPDEKTRGCDDVSTMTLTRESDAARCSNPVSRSKSASDSALRRSGSSSVR